jgi:hypothetical protein
MANFPLTKQVFDKTAFDNTVNTSFSELTSSVVVSTGSNLPSVVEFFQYYQDLFYQIPKFGDTTSHQYLVITSQEYIGSENGGNEVVDALIAEITALREENLDLQQQLAQNFYYSLTLQFNRRMLEVQLEEEEVKTWMVQNLNG